MRGQEPGSEHDRREADRTTARALPPPSFGQTDGDVPRTFTGSEEPTGDEARLSRTQAQSGEASPGQQPWEVAGDDSAAYDWFADDEPDTAPTAAPAPPTRPTAGTPPVPYDPTTGAPRGPRADEDSLTTPHRHTTPSWPPTPEPPHTSRWAPEPPAPAPPTWAPPASDEPAWTPEASDTTEWAPRTAAEATWGRPETPRQDPEPDHTPTWAPPTEDHPTAPRTESDAAWGPRAEGDTAWGPRAEGGTSQGRQGEGGASWAATPEEWAATPEEEPPAWPAKPVVPGAPPWEPPPAFTAAAAGLQVWPAPVADPDVMPPWPAATGELVAEPDTDDPATTPPAPQTGHPTGHAADPATSAQAGPAMDPQTGHPTVPLSSPAFTAATGAPTDLNATTPASLRSPDAPPQDRDTGPYNRDRDTTPYAPDASLYGGGRDASPYDPDATRPGGLPRTAHYFDPEAAKRDAAAHQQATPAPPHDEHNPVTQNTPPQGIRTSDPREEPTGPMRTAHYVEPHPTNPTGRPPEPGDVPVWPPVSPTPPIEERHQGDNQPTPRNPAEDRPEDKNPATPRPAANQTADNRADNRADSGAETWADVRTADLQRTEESRAEEGQPQDKRSEDKPSEDRLPDLPFNQDMWTKRPSTALDLPTPPQGTPTFPPGAFRQPPFQIPPPPPPARGKSRRALLVTLGALALAGVATGGFFAYRALSTTPPPAATTAARPTPPALPSAELSTSPPADVPGASMLNSEETDPQKLSLTEAFPKKKVSAAGTTFTRVKTDMETSCEKAATGAFADALREQKCSRIVRATYVDSKRRYAVTTGIAVLPTKDAAVLADQAKNLSRNIWFRALPGAEGSGGERVSIAGGYAAGLVWGRYVVFSYATHADGHTPEAKEKTLAKVSGAFRDQTSLVLERRVTKG
ncbi:hypothetical protein ACFFV7_37190 [Nonomuraea spiralis]|uniref:Uncharacterized protein n=1 Tax=Nonomuraea spiralis TaxID=46182 RepID=A0ABV5ISA3_9ACTN